MVHSTRDFLYEIMFGEHMDCIVVFKDGWVTSLVILAGREGNPL